MCSEWIQTFCHVRDSVEKHRWILIAGAVWFTVCACWAVNDQNKMFEFYGFSASAIDYIIAQQGAIYSGLTIFPFTLLFVIKCKQNSLDIQYILRYQSREKMLRKQFVESLIYAIGTATVLVGVMTVIGWIISGKLINWNATDSVYFGQTGEAIQANFLVVAAVIWMMYIMKFVLIFAITDISMWCPKTLFLVWIILIIPLGIETFHYGRVYFGLFAIWQNSWLSVGKWSRVILGGILFWSLEYLVGKKIIERRDIWG